MPRFAPRPKLSPEELKTKYQDMFEDWIVECEAMRLALVEGMLAHLPSLKDG